MENLSRHCSAFVLTILCTCVTLPLITRAQEIEDSGFQKQLARSNPLFIFGDSLFDTGNNLYFRNSLAGANLWPYGVTFFGRPAGRFSDGLIFPDFIAEFAKLPPILPYLEPGEKDYTSGVNFAFARSGALASTKQGTVIDLKTQLRYFKKVVKQLKGELGEEESRELLSNAVYMFSVGSNDHVFAISTNSTLLEAYHPNETFIGLEGGNSPLAFTIRIQGWESCMLWFGPVQRAVILWSAQKVPLVRGYHRLLFDGGHPTQKSYRQMAEEWWTASTNVATPYNLKKLFES